MGNYNIVFAKVVFYTYGNKCMNDRGISMSKFIIYHYNE